MKGVIMRNFLGILFYPWFSAAFWAGYSLFTQSDLYMKKFKWGGKSACVRHFLDYNGKDFIAEAIKRHSFRIIFFPWTFQYHVDFDGEDF